MVPHHHFRIGVPPLQDAISVTAGSAAYGGPVDADGRLLIRERIMLSLGSWRKWLKYHGDKPGSIQFVILVHSGKLT